MGTSCPSTVCRCPFTTEGAPARTSSVVGAAAAAAAGAGAGATRAVRTARERGQLATGVGVVGDLEGLRLEPQDFLGERGESVLGGHWVLLEVGGSFIPPWCTGTCTGA